MRMLPGGDGRLCRHTAEPELATATRRAFGTGVFRDPQRVVATVAVRDEGDDGGGASDPAPRARDPRQQPHVVPRPARARLPRRPAAPPRALPDQGRALQEAAARVPAASDPPDPG